MRLAIFSTFYSQRSVAETRTNPSPWNILIQNRRQGTRSLLELDPLKYVLGDIFLSFPLKNVNFHRFHLYTLVHISLFAMETELNGRQIL